MVLDLINLEIAITFDTYIQKATAYGVQGIEICNKENIFNMFKGVTVVLPYEKSLIGVKY